VSVDEIRNKNRELDADLARLAFCAEYDYAEFARTVIPLLLDVAEAATNYLDLPPSIPHNMHHERARALGIALASLISATPTNA
jgi:hypothetical protein